MLSAEVINKLKPGDCIKLDDTKPWNKRKVYKKMLFLTAQHPVHAGYVAMIESVEHYQKTGAVTFIPSDSEELSI